ncbi:hypothetical protein R1sor_009220 [Riccia sorocarpa]|uniref:Uncharacterized protein n=1 Tax=Riccia sorocarpa TaxID=122646 RepID=A0ABD3H716_9MARC
MNIGEEDSKTALSTLEGTFQVAFRTGRLWEVQESIFRKWECKELKSMKSSAKAKKKDDGEMCQTWWRPLQDERLYSFEKSFDLMLKDRSCSNSITKALYGVDEPEPEGGKRKRASKAKSLVQVLPPEFLDHIDSARAYKEVKESGRAVPVPEQTFKHWVKEGSLQSVKWDDFHGDKLPDADSEVTRGHKHSKDVAPPTCDGAASMVEMSVPETVDDVIRLEKDQVPGSAGTGGSEAEDGTEDPEGIDPEARAEEAEEAEEEVPEHEQDLGLERVVPDSLLGE